MHRDYEYYKNAPERGLLIHSRRAGTRHANVIELKVEGCAILHKINEKKKESDKKNGIPNWDYRNGGLYEEI